MRYPLLYTPLKRFLRSVARFPDRKWQQDQWMLARGNLSARSCVKLCPCLSFVTRVRTNVHRNAEIKSLGEALEIVVPLRCYCWAFNSYYEYCTQVVFVEEFFCLSESAECGSPLRLRVVPLYVDDQKPTESVGTA